MIGARPDFSRGLSEVLELLTHRVQLTETQHQRAERAYGNVTKWLAADEAGIGRFAPDLFPQGSLRLGTTVKPIARSEFDLDIVCLLGIEGDLDPGEVYEMVWDRMCEHGTYREIMERMPRCIRLNYAEDSQFHLDIVPAIPDASKGEGCILIPDKPDPELTTWKTSNPRGYAKWFERMTVLLEKYARAEIEPLPGRVPADQKAALARAVQLLKRWRDVRFADDPKLGPPSIILTTLAAEQYMGESLPSDALTNILEGLVAFVRSGRREIRNPVNSDEIISEKWLRVPDSYEAFVEAISEFRDQWYNIINAPNLVGVTDGLHALFGELAREAVKAASERVARARSDGGLYVNRGTGSIMTDAAPAAAPSAVVRSRPNTFFGD